LSKRSLEKTKVTNTNLSPAGQKSHSQRQQLLIQPFFCLSKRSLQKTKVTNTNLSPAAQKSHSKRQQLLIQPFLLAKKSTKNQIIETNFYTESSTLGHQKKTYSIGSFQWIKQRRVEGGILFSGIKLGN
jgi:hypothetical protein